jgi:hypothetical protein
VTVLLALWLIWIQGTECADVSDCRTQAEAAAASGNYERFHDLAWRAVQKGKPNDPDLMYVLARAQARSGRYDDALVMLGRLADRHVTLDVTTNADFAKLRLLPQWPALEARLRGDPAPSAPPPAASAPSAPEAAIDFEPPPSFDPFALAHDAVSRRFVIGDRAGSRLLVVDETSHNVVTYVTAATAGFEGAVTGLAIDARRGDLWVSTSSALHKLQLISGRTLMAVPVESGASLAAVDVAPDGAVYAIDGADGRLLRLRAGSRSAELVMRVNVTHPSALAVVDDRSVVIAGDTGLVRVDVAARTARAVLSEQPLGGFVTLATHGRALVGVQRIGGAFSAVRVTLEVSGARATSWSVLGVSAEPVVGALAGNTFYLLAGHSIRRVSAGG